MSVTGKRKIMFVEIVGGFVVSILAFLFHFLYQWSGQNYAVGLISAVNESVWEHVKILFFPYLIYTIVEYFIISPEFKKFFIAKTVGLFSIIVMLISVFYTYTGIIGHHVPVFDMISAIIYAFLAHYFSYKIIVSDINQKKNFYLYLVLFLAMLVATLTFTVNPPKLPLFYDSANGYYGMQNMS